MSIDYNALFDATLKDMMTGKIRPNDLLDKTVLFLKYCDDGRRFKLMDIGDALNLTWNSEKTRWEHTDF